MAIDGMFQIGEVAESVGLSLRTIRHYDEVGLVPPSGRSTGGFRLYTDGDIERLRLVKSLKPLDLSLDEICELLTIRERLASGEAADDEIERLAAFSVLADARYERLRDQLASVKELAQMLRDESKPRSASSGT